MLLTSAQVSLAISSFVVFFFTTALFLSGYVLQQQTVRDLRAAIQPQLIKAPPTGPDLYLPPQFRDAEYWEAKGVVDAMVMAQERAKAEVEDGGGVMNSEDGDGNEMVGATRWQKKKAREERRRKAKGNSGAQRVLEEEEKEVAESVVEEKEGDSGIVEEESKEEHLSPAERRRRIKEQILAEGEGEGFKGYRRRMW